MNKIRLSNFEISEIAEQIDDEIMNCERIIFNFADMKHIAAFAMAKTIELFDEKLDDTLTLDELNIAGASSEDNNYYLNEGVDYYTMSPAVFNGSAYMCIINSNGQMDATSPRYKLVVKPVINLIDSLEIVGQGTAESPYLT